MRNPVKLTMAMHQSVCLLVSRCPTVIEQVRAIALGTPHLKIEVCSAQRAPARAKQPDVCLILTHLGQGDETAATRLIWAVARAGKASPTVVLCDRVEEHQAASLLRAGAADYVAFPKEAGRLGFLLGVLTRRFRPAPAAPAPDDQWAVPDPDGLEAIMAQVRRVASQEATVLLTGETGTGKTRLARLVHELSPRREQPFLVVDCGSLSASLIESELFGHAKGAFTGADRERQGKLGAAGAGTLLLDEVNSLPLALQGKLLRAVDERVYEPVGADRPLPVRARLVAASNVPLEAEVQAGRFRSDLYFRLNVVGFFLPPLRERRSAVAPLALRFLREFAARNRPDVSGFSPGAQAALKSFHWPGNVRELRNVVERAIALTPNTVIEADDLPEAVRNAPPRVPSTSLAKKPATWAVTLHQSKDEVEVRRIKEALLRNGNKRAGAARELGISRVGLYKKLQKYGIVSPRQQGDDGPEDEPQGKEQSIVPVGADVPINRVESPVRPPSRGLASAPIG